MVLALRSNHANLLRRPVNSSTDVVKIRLVTNGLWPVVEQPDGQPLGALGSDRGRLEGASGRGPDGVVRDSSWRKGEREDIGESGNAASLATEIAELFDSVSVALNSADTAQYDEVRRRHILRSGLSRTPGWRRSFNPPPYE